MTHRTTLTRYRSAFRHALERARGALALAGHAGGVLVRTVVAVATLVVIGGAIVAVLQTTQQNQQVNHRKALAISEYGLMVALQKLFEEPRWSGGIEKTSYDGGWYSVSLQQRASGDTVYLTVESEGRMGSIAERRECVLRLDTSGGDSVWVRESMR